MHKPPHLSSNHRPRRNLVMWELNHPDEIFNTSPAGRKYQGSVPSKLGAWHKTCNSRAQRSTALARRIKSHQPAVETGSHYPGFPGRRDVPRAAPSTLKKRIWNTPWPAIVSLTTSPGLSSYTAFPFYLYSGLSAPISQDLLTEHQWGFLFLTRLWRKGGKKNPLEIICILPYNTSFRDPSEKSFTSEEIANILESAARRFS